MNSRTVTENNILPVILLILDGWGYSETVENNAILSARTPAWDQLWDSCPHTLIHGSGKNVGLPHDQMGNSEVGHLNLGAGRVVYQEFTRIDNAIETGEFNTNPVLNQALDQALASGNAIHIMGLLSPGGVHSHENQIHAMVRMAAERGVEDIHIHAFLDGRDTAPQSAASSIAGLEAVLEQLGKGRISSIVGRYYAMDRDNRWDRIQIAYDLITDGKAEFLYPTAQAALAAAYDRSETDEFVQASAIISDKGTPARINDGDIIIFMNFRADRARQITEAFINPDFNGFKRRRELKLGDFVCLTEYKKSFAATVAFPPASLKNVLGAYLADHNRRQLRIAETEKYAHVTFFFNGGEETPFAGEDRILIESPQVATYDLKPEMHAPELTDKLVDAISGRQYDVIICNFANPDMVGHTGIFAAAVKAIEAIDQCLARIVTAIKTHGGELLITADHGNAELMVNPESGQPQTAHTTNPVPFIYLGRAASISETGTLSDVAPTILHLLGMPQPPEMTGHSLVTFKTLD
jgi:2,3-bisphosphoglycerate-independent phosphoglycerate mutase